MTESKEARVACDHIIPDSDCAGCEERRNKWMRAETESYWREKIAGELENQQRFGLIWDEYLGDIIGADLNGNYLHRPQAIAKVRKG